MKNDKNTLNISSKIIIPKKGVSEELQANKDNVLQDLESITTGQINIIGTNIECRKLITNLHENPDFQISEEDAYLLIDNGHYVTVSRLINRVNAESHKKIAMRIINKIADEGLNYNRKFFEKFKGLDSDVALLMIKRGLVKKFEDIITKFEKLNKKVAIAYHEATGEYLEPMYFGEGEMKEISLYYINNGIEELDLCYVPCDLAFAKEILKTKNNQKIEIICSNIQYFKKEDHKEIALEIIKNRGERIRAYISNFFGLDKEVAFALTDNGIYTHNLAIYKEEDRKEIALYQLDHGYKPGMENVNGLDLDFANKIIEKKFFKFLIDNLEYFPKSEHKAIALNIINTGYKLTYSDLTEIKGKDKELILALFKQAEEKDPEESGDASTEHEIEVRKKAIANYIAKYPSEFTGLDDEIASILIDFGLGKEVKRHKELYKDLSLLTKTRLILK